jgi:hypothetical protein
MRVGILNGNFIDVEILLDEPEDLEGFHAGFSAFSD